MGQIKKFISCRMEVHKMLLGLGGILALIAIGAVIMIVVNITVNWIRKRIEEKLRKKTAKKVFMKEIGQMVEDCENEMTLEELNSVKETAKDADFVMATLDENNQVDEVELIKDQNSKLDREVEELLKSKKEILVTG